MASRGEDYQKALFNDFFDKPLLDGIRKPLNSLDFKYDTKENRPTFEIYKVDDYVHKAEYRQSKFYRGAVRLHEEYNGIDLVKYWWKFMLSICDERGCSMYELAETSGMPKLLKYLNDGSHANLFKFGLIYRFALIIGEPFIPIYTQKELDNFQIPNLLKDKVIKQKRINSLEPFRYGLGTMPPGKKSALRNKRKK